MNKMDFYNCHRHGCSDDTLLMSKQPFFLFFFLPQVIRGDVLSSHALRHTWPLTCLFFILLIAKNVKNPCYKFVCKLPIRGYQRRETYFCLYKILDTLISHGSFGHMNITSS